MKLLLIAFLPGAALLAQTPQRVEGFASLIHSPSANSRPSAVPADFRGPARGHMTPPWWTTGPHERLKWRTAPVPEKNPTVFAFIGSTAVVPAEFSVGPKARLFLNEKPVITFDTGQTRDRVWKQGEIELRYEARRAEWPYGAAHRQFDLNGDSGIYHLSVPAAAVTPGEGATIEVELLPFPAWPNGWFMVKDRTDTLSETQQALTEQVRQLQRDVTRLQELTHVLATNQYTSLLDVGRSPWTAVDAPVGLGGMTTISRTGTGSRPGGRLRTRGFAPPIAGDMQHSVIYTNGWRHLHPADIIRLKNGDLLVTAREAAEHLARDGDVIMLRSKDEGKTWGDKQVIANIKDLDEREGCGVQLKDGTIVVAIFYNALYRDNGDYEWEWSKKVKFGQGKRYLGTYIITSRDDGRTWSQPNHIDTKGMPFTDLEGPADAPIEMPDGSILLPVMGYNVRGDITNQAAVLLKSTDKAKTWSYLSTMAEDPGGKLGSFQEPGIVRTRTGRIVAAIRNQGPEQAIWTTHSDDDGKTWTPVKQSPMIGHPADLIQLADGRLLCTYGTRAGRHADPGGIRATFSNDNGETWQIDKEVQIRRDFLNLDIGYPDSMQMADGRILTVYYFNMFGRFFLGQTIWKP